jgi:alkylhydroperoxidase family enzyme
MKIDELKKLAELEDYDTMSKFITVSKQTILALIALIELQHEALKYHVEQTRPIHRTEEALAAYEKFGKEE